MPYTHIEDRRKNSREYYKKNREKILQRESQYNQKPKVKAKRRKYAEEYFKNPINQKRRIEYQIKRRKEEKEKVFSHYSKGTMKCVCCGEKHIDFLTIDHIEGNGNKHRKEIGTAIYWWLIKNNYPSGFQVLCMNCNFAKGHLGYCPHEMEK